MPLVLSGTVFGGQGHATTYNMPKRSHGGVIKLTPKRARYGPRRPVVRRRRIGKARPMRGLKTNYRALNVYRFVRETMPTTTSFTIISQGVGSYADMGYMSFENLQMNQLPGQSDDFKNLFARYKVDKIVTTLVPLWEETPNDAARAVNSSPELEITKVNTKYMIGDFPIQSTAESQLNELAQLQCKTVTKYSSKRPLVLTTMNPGTKNATVVDATGTEIDSRGPCPWLSWNTTNVQFKHNAIVFGRRVDGGAVDANWKYQVRHKIFFRCSQVG